MSYIGTYQISDTENELQGMLHGTTLNQITDEFGVYNRAARKLLEDVDPQETRIVSQFGKVYNGVFDYPCAADMKGNKLVDLYPEANRTLQDNYNQNYNKDFDLWKNYRVYPDFTMRYAGGVRTLRVNAVNLTSGTQINAADDTNDNGTWTASGGASNVQQNQLFFTDGAAASVQIQLNAGQIQGSIFNRTMTAVNLTQNYNNNADFFFQVYIPDITAITSLIFYVGSSQSTYFSSGNINTDAQGNAWQNGWNLIKVPWASLTETGNVNVAAINLLQVTFNYNSTLQQQVLINQFYSRIGFIFTQEYYSKFLFRDSVTNAFQEKVTNASNYVNLDTDGYNLFLLQSAIQATQQQQGLDATFADMPNFSQAYATALQAYKLKYRSEVLKPHSYYYRTPQTTYRRWFGFGRTPSS